MSWRWLTDVLWRMTKQQAIKHKSVSPLDGAFESLYILPSDVGNSLLCSSALFCPTATHQNHINEIAFLSRSLETHSKEFLTVPTYKKKKWANMAKIFFLFTVMDDNGRVWADDRKFLIWKIKKKMEIIVSNPNVPFSNLVAVAFLCTLDYI